MARVQAANSYLVKVRGYFYRLLVALIALAYRRARDKIVTKFIMLKIWNVVKEENLRN